MYENIKTMDELKAVCEIALAHKKGITVLVKLPGMEAPEEIYNPPSNVRAKRNYYTKTYGSDLKMKNNQAIKIVGCYTK